MTRAAIRALFVVVALATGFAAVILLSHHPVVTALNLGEETADAKAALRACRLYASWQVEIRQGEPLLLERRVCPVGFHHTDDDDNWVSPVHHEVLLLEKRGWWKTQIQAALFSDLDFTQVDVGKTREGRDAVIWAFFIKCGSCHGGPIGVLTWSASRNSYLWNEDWFDRFSKRVQAALPADDYADSPPKLRWESNDTKIGYQNSVYASGDAHCCPSGGEIVGDFEVIDGHLALKDKFIFAADPAKAASDK